MVSKKKTFIKQVKFSFWSVFQIIFSLLSSLTCEFVGLWFGAIVRWFFTIHRFGTDSFITFDRCKQWHSVKSTASIFLLCCTWFGHRWIIRHFCIIHWMVGNMPEKLLRAKHCKWCTTHFTFDLHFKIDSARKFCACIPVENKRNKFTFRVIFLCSIF